MLARNGGVWWDSTEQTAMVLFGLVDYLAASHELESDFVVQVLVNGRVAGERHFTAADAQSGASLTIDVDAAQLQPGANSVRIVRRGGSGRAYWSARGATSPPTRRLSGGHHVAESDSRLLQASTGAEGRQDRLLAQPLNGTAQVGDVLAVHEAINGYAHALPAA